MGYGNKSISDWQREAYETAVEKGWYEDDRTFGDIIALIHSELSEALESFRNNPHFETTYLCPYICGEVTFRSCLNEEQGIVVLHKPIGIPIEFADVIIRILDTCEKYEINIEDALRIKMKYNKTRPYRHGGNSL